MSENVKNQNFFFEWMDAFVYALVIVILLLTFIFRIIGVDGESMTPTLDNGNKVMVSSLFYTPKTGDIIVIAQPNFTNKPIIKRIIATEGQTIDIDYNTNSVYVDGMKLDEPYIKEPMLDRSDPAIKLPLTLKEGEVFVMGDNRNGSTDSRSSKIGIINSQYIIGRVIIRIAPINEFGKVN